MEKQYTELIQSLKEHVRSSQQQAVLAVNTRLLFLYWEIGHFINHQKEKLGWGASVIKQISKDLSTEFPEIKGFSERNLVYMSQFAEIHSIVITQPPAAQIENKEEIEKKSNEIEKTQPPAAQIQSSIHWIDFINTPIAKIDSKYYVKYTQ